MEIILNFSEIDSFDNLEDLKELNCVNLFDLPYNLTILDKEETYDKLNLKDKNFKKVSRKEKEKYLYKVLKEIFKERLKLFVFDQYISFVETSLNENDKIYFVYNNTYIDFFTRKAYLKKNKKLIEYKDFDFFKINYKDIESINFVSNQKITDIIKDIGRKSFRKYSRKNLIETYIEENFVIGDFLDYYLEEAFELYDDEMFSDWLDYVSYNDFIKQMKEEYDK